MALRGGRFSSATSDDVAKYSESISFDKRLYKHDIMGSKAHVKMPAAQGVALEVTDKAKEFIADEGYDPAFGARPLKRAVIRLIETPVSRLLLQGEYPENSTLLIDSDGEKLSFSRKDSV